MQYLKAENDVVIQYPYTKADLRRDNPDTSFPASMSDELLATYGVFPVTEVAPPPHDQLFETLTELTPVLTGVWTQTWQVTSATPAEVTANQSNFYVNARVASGDEADAFAQANGFRDATDCISWDGSAIIAHADIAVQCLEIRDGYEGDALSYYDQCVSQAVVGDTTTYGVQTYLIAEPWVQPQGAHDAYPIDAAVTHNDKGWRNLTPDNVWEPGVAGWRIMWQPAEGLPMWVQPSGSSDAYQIGDKVSHNGGNWVSNTANNVWEPGVFGWDAL